MRDYFYKDILYKVYPISEEKGSFLKPLKYEHLPAAPQSIYIYDGKPTVKDARNGEANEGDYEIIQTITTGWTDTKDAQGKQFTIAPIDDPEPEQDQTSQSYSPFNYYDNEHHGVHFNSYYKRPYEVDFYVVVNTTLEGETGIHTVIRELTLERLRFQETPLIVDIEELFVDEPELSRLCSTLGDLQNYINSAIRDLRCDLEGCDTRFVQALSPAQLERYVRYRSISNWYFAKSRTQNDAFVFNGMRWEKKADEAFKRLNIKFDKEGDGIPEPTRNGGFRSLRFLT